ncbi:MAG: TSUP family transporter [Alphaproteobacteria bacterium]|nr:TSUP family transporter [Alphaproteobacteria bacterium]
MELNLTMFLIVCPLVFLAEFIDAIGGGGGLISLPAYLIAGLPAHMAVGTNKLSSTLGTIVSTARYWKHNYYDYELSVIGAITALFGAIAGAQIALFLDDAVFKMILLILLPLIAIYVLLKKDLEPKNTTSISRKKQYIIVAVATFLLGIYDGFYGPGSGTFLILVYVGLAKMNILTAEGNAKVVNLIATGSSLVVFLLNGAVLIPLGLAAAVFSMAGHYFGAGVAMKNGAKVVRLVILSVIAILFIKVIWDAGGYFINWF